MSYEKVTKLKSRIIIGTKQALKAMKNGSIHEVYLAMDADQHIIQKVEQLARELNIPCQYVDSKKKLGTACGIEVGASTVAVKKQAH
ncbi:MAG TPA: ribosomal L7Ae/L30e/S12e/Gadd45 family protein [Bacillota bacterium]